MQQNRPSLSEQETIRREKLEELMSSGNSPYAITSFDKTMDSDDIIRDYAELEGKLCL